MNATYSPDAMSSPALRAEETPPLDLWTTRMRESFAAYSSQILPLLSFEPSIDKYQFEILKRLRENRVHAAVQRLFGVVCRNYD